MAFLFQVTVFEAIQLLRASAARFLAMLVGMFLLGSVCRGAAASSAGEVGNGQVSGNERATTSQAGSEVSTNATSEGSQPAAPVSKEKKKKARLAISGYGFFGNRELKRMLRSLQVGKEKPEYFTATFVEDSALLLTARVKRDGYLQPKIIIKLDLADGESMKITADELVENPLPRPLRVSGAEFEIHEGRLYYYEDLQFEGLESIPEKRARSFFMETETLLKLKRNRVYTPDRLKRGTSSLTSELERLGYQEAKVEASEPEVNDETGAVSVALHVTQGPRHVVRSVQEEWLYEDGSQPATTNTVYPKKAYSRVWQQDFILSLKTNLYYQGYPDPTVGTRILQRDAENDRVELDLLAVIKSGPLIHAGDVKFQGEKYTRQSLMDKRVPLEQGELLNRVKAEQGRSRLAELGIFRDVSLSYDPVGEHTRDVIYTLEEAKRLNLSLLFGWGSYEMLRGGLVVDALNIWGLAHHARLRVIQSLKSSRGDFTYTIPAFFGKDVDVFVHGSGLRREEVDFTRVEYGGGVGAHKFYKEAALDATLRYNYGILSALETIPAVESEGLISPAVGSIISDLRLDRRDNPLYPRRGYKVFSTLETATEYIGGEANYQRVEIFTSWHHRLGGGRYISLGVSHGVDVTFGSVANNLPFNRRFFPGGDHSIRGYQEGEASPRNAEGKFVGAESYVLGTVELEQALTPTWSLVFFSDSLGFAHHVEDYPFNTGLYSVGGGIRWKTIIGPVRLEYGYNLNRRKDDPTGTLHFSLGYPF